MKNETMGWQWHQLDHTQIIFTSLQTDNHASTSSLINQPAPLNKKSFSSAERIPRWNRLSQALK